MTSRPAIPSLVLIPGESKPDYEALYAIATAYAHSGLLISNHGKETDRPEFFLPAVVCSSFAIELFLKFFLMLERARNEDPDSKPESGHRLKDLWEKIRPEHQALIAGMFRNRTGEPLLNASSRRIELFVEALTHLGDKPFVEWRYAHELNKPALVSHAAIIEVLDSLGHAADYVINRGTDPIRQEPEAERGK